MGIQKLVSEARVLLEFIDVIKVLATPNDHGYPLLDTENDGWFFLWGNGHVALTNSHDRDAFTPEERSKLGSIPFKWTGSILFKTNTLEMHAGPAMYSDGLEVNDFDEFRKLLKDLMRAEPKIDPSWQVVGLDAYLTGSIKKLLELDVLAPSKLDQLKKPSFGFSGTSAKRALQILKAGLRPGMFKGVYNDLISGYSEKMVYLGVEPSKAEFYARRQATWENSTSWVILKVQIPDKDLLRVSETDAFPQGGSSPERAAFMRNLDLSKMLAKTGEIAYEGHIPPKFISVFKSYPSWDEIVAKNKKDMDKTVKKLGGPTAFVLEVFFSKAGVRLRAFPMKNVIQFWGRERDGMFDAEYEPDEAITRFVHDFAQALLVPLPQAIKALAPLVKELKAADITSGGAKRPALSFVVKGSKVIQQ